jgi:unsaturated rhamnogalacturonyl hydrolase
MKTTARVLILLAIAFSVKVLNAQNTPSEQLAKTVMSTWKDSFALGTGRPAKWSYDQGVILKGFEGLWQRTGDPKYFNYIQKSMDFYVDNDGNIKGYNREEYTLDNINNGKLLLLLYRVTGKEKYWKAATKLRDQLRTHPRTKEGGFWHKKTYPYQMWLDGLYMAGPFYAEYAYLAHEDTTYNDITKQFIYMENHSRDGKTGLLYHGWDESKQQKWSNPQTGNSPNFWGRAMGWYAMALVDVLDYIPENHPQRANLAGILNRLSTAVLKVQDSKSGLWYDLLDKPNEKGNYLEASASSMFVYALAKGVRKGYLPESIMPAVRKGYDGILKQFIKTDANGLTNLEGTVSVSGLGGSPYRNGSVAYYLGEKVIVNDPKGMGAFLLASNEMETAPNWNIGKGKTVLLDNYFNNETKKDITGKTVSWHYTWDDYANSGFSTFGHLFEQDGAKLKTLKEGPTARNLAGASVYIIVDPDTKTESPNPNYMSPQFAQSVYDWVKQGGVLAIFMNDSINTEFEHFNLLPEKFGIHFNQNARNMVKNDYFPTGAFNLDASNPIFKSPKKVYLKEISTLKLTPPATPILTEGGDNIIAISKVGKGVVFAVGDPWIYNEYADGRKLPLEYENFKAAKDLAQWLLKQAKK